MSHKWSWYSLDQFPQREDPVEALALSIKTVKQMERLLGRLDQTTLTEAISRHDYRPIHTTFLDALEQG